MNEGIHRRMMRWAGALEARSTTVVLFIVLGALAIRLVWAALVPVLPTSDSGAYMLYAKTLLETGEYAMSPGQPNAFWAPGTGMLIAGLWYIFGPSFTPVIVANIFFSVALVPMVFILAQRWAGTLTALVAAFMIGFWPTFIMYVTVLQSEQPFLFVLSLGLVAYLWDWDAQWKRVLVAGFFFGLACYFRPVALLLPFALGFVTVLRQWRSWKREATVAVLTMAAMLIVLSPWTYRNSQVLGQPALVSTNFGLALWNGNHPGTPGTYVPPPPWVEGLSHVEADRLMLKRALEYIEEDPLGFVQRTAWKTLVQHRGQTIAVVWNPSVEQRYGPWAVFFLKAIGTLCWYSTVALGLVGLGIAVWRFGLIGLFHPAFIIWAYFTGVHAVTQAGGRFQLPSVPFVIIMAAIAIVTLLRLGDAMPAYRRKALPDALREGDAKPA
ncbi:MAG: glycosyltransferase family 39 protein [Pseudomonadota bacterium]